MRSSLGLRLLLTAAVTTGLALIATALVLNLQFRAYFDQRIETELDGHLFMVTGNLGLDENGDVAVAEVPDARFQEPLSGYYWQVEIEGAEPLLSPSFWAVPLDLPPAEEPGEIEYLTVETEAGERLSLANWVIQTGAGEGERRVRVTVALDRAEMDRLVGGFFRSSVIWLAAMGAFLLAASWVQVHIGLRPLEKVRGEVDRIASASKARLGDDYPSEVLPLVGGLNALLDANEAAIERARAQAGNLAHGLKTPLAVMQGIAARLRQDGRAKVADETETEIRNMQHIVERELARTRDSQQTMRRCQVAPVAHRLAAVLAEQPGAEHINWQVEVPEDLEAPFDEFDLTELLGNLLDNAMKWADCRIILRALRTDERAALIVEDDGPGIAPDEVETVLSRGGRLSEDRPGHGLGLSIVRDMAESHRCELHLEESEHGGLRVAVSWKTSDA